ncbi:hypothetical protein BDZ89DRAFT_1071808 [Hymenopellis radicata]|nr:hypothetical protein BDZ89DRAFT_1071808 [Hymenopellis radicata]
MSRHSTTEPCNPSFLPHSIADPVSLGLKGRLVLNPSFKLFLTILYPEHQHLQLELTQSMNPPPERRSRRLRDSSSSIVPQQQPSSITFPPSTTYSREEDTRAGERERNRSQGAASLRGTTNVSRREITAREGT